MKLGADKPPVSLRDPKLSQGLNITISRALVIRWAADELGF